MYQYIALFLYGKYKYDNKINEQKIIIMNFKIFFFSIIIALLLTVVSISIYMNQLLNPEFYIYLLDGIYNNLENIGINKMGLFFCVWFILSISLMLAGFKYFYYTLHKIKLLKALNLFESYTIEKYNLKTSKYTFKLKKGVEDKIGKNRLFKYNNILNSMANYLHKDYAISKKINNLVEVELITMEELQELSNDSIIKKKLIMEELGLLEDYDMTYLSHTQLSIERIPSASMKNSSSYFLNNDKIKTYFEKDYVIITQQNNNTIDFLMLNKEDILNKNYDKEYEKSIMEVYFDFGYEYKILKISDKEIILEPCSNYSKHTLFNKLEEIKGFYKKDYIFVVNEPPKKIILKLLTQTEYNLKNYDTVTEMEIILKILGIKDYKGVSKIGQTYIFKSILKENYFSVSKQAEENLKTFLNAQEIYIDRKMGSEEINISYK